VRTGKIVFIACPASGFDAWDSCLSVVGAVIAPGKVTRHDLKCSHCLVSYDSRASYWPVLRVSLFTCALNSSVCIRQPDTKDFKTLTHPILELRCPQSHMPATSLYYFSCRRFMVSVAALNQEASKLSYSLPFCLARCHLMPSSSVRYFLSLLSLCLLSNKLSVDHSQVLNEIGEHVLFSLILCNPPFSFTVPSYSLTAIRDGVIMF
jgi:hypothetical protein